MLHLTYKREHFKCVAIARTRPGTRLYCSRCEYCIEFAKTIPPEKVDSKGYIDIVGTGGDGQNTFNVSTSSAIVAAGMGLPVCKHGGKASTSTSGSGDLLKSLGVDLSKVDETTTPEIVSQSKFCFCLPHRSTLAWGWWHIFVPSLGFPLYLIY